MNSTAVSAREAEVIEAIETRGLIVFSPRDIARFLGSSRRNVYRILGNMVEKGLVTRLRQGVYVLSETYDRLDSYELASALEPASYIGFWSALHLHHLTDQVPRTIFLATTTQKRPLTIQGQQVRFVRLSPRAFFGYERSGDVVVSDPEKTIIDCLRLPEHAGGIRHIDRAMNRTALDGARLTEYARQLDNGAVAARLGYLGDRHDIAVDRKALSSLIRSYTRLDPAGDRTNPNREWQLYTNVNLDA